MEVLYQSDSMYARSPGMMHPGPVPRLYVSPKDVYMCYSYEADTPSRTPTPERPQKPYTPTEASQGKTLQSVLRGEVPAAYSHLASQRCSSQALTEGTVQTEPMDLSCKRSPSPHYGYSRPEEPSHHGEFSLLRNLLSVGKSAHEISRECDSPTANEYLPRYEVSSSTRVTLAKKNMFPVGARVSDWLVKLVHFAKSIPEFLNLSHNDKVTLILNSWSRLLLLYMAESHFQFAVTPLSRSQGYESDSTSQDEPTMKSVEGVQTFIRKCQHMNVEGKEYAFLRMLVLFNAGYVGLDRPDTVDQLNLAVQQLLQQHVQITRPDDVMHYSRLLLCLPSLYGINSKMIESLFCRHINRNTDMEVLLKEMLQNL